MLRVTIDYKDSISLPAEALKALGAKEGDLLELEISEGKIVLCHLRQTTSSLKETIARKNLQTQMQFIKGVGPKLSELLARRGVKNVEDALYLLPHRYEDRREVQAITHLRPGLTEVFSGKVQCRCNLF